ncbi:MAG: ABC transporter substrate-binding protein [Janthinobacterium lividum]
MEALNAGAVDAGSVGEAPFVFGIASAIPMKALSITCSDGVVTALVVSAASPIGTVTDLKGRSIATLVGQTGYFLVLAALQRAGLQAKDVHFMFLAPADPKVRWQPAAWILGRPEDLSTRLRMVMDERCVEAGGLPC